MIHMRHHTPFTTATIRFYAESEFGYASLYTFTNSDYTSSREIGFQLYVTIHFPERCLRIIMQNLNLDMRHYTLSPPVTIRYPGLCCTGLLVG